MLSHDQLLGVRAAAISARLSASRAALLAGLSAELVASLPQAASPGEQVLCDLDALNAVGTLIDGSEPLAIWLANAVALAGPRVERAIFEQGLATFDKASSRRSTGPSPSGLVGLWQRLGWWRLVIPILLAVLAVVKAALPVAALDGASGPTATPTKEAPQKPGPDVSVKAEPGSAAAVVIGNGNVTSVVVNGASSGSSTPDGGR